MSSLLVYKPLLDVILITTLLALGMFCWLRTGLFSIASPGLALVGAYAFVLGAVKLKLPLPVAAIFAFLMVLLVALVLGRLILRLFDDYYAMATLAFSELMRLLALNWTGLTNGSLGVSGLPKGVQTWHIVIAVVFSLYFMHRLSSLNSKLGRVMATVREDQLLAGSIGIYLTKYKVMYFVLGAIPIALAGILQAGLYRYIVPFNYGFAMTTVGVSIIVLGGREKPIGALIGAIIYSIIPELLRVTKGYMLLIQATILLIIIIFLPWGFVGFYIRNIKPAFLKKFPKLRRSKKVGTSVTQVATTTQSLPVDTWLDSLQELKLAKVDSAMKETATLFELKSISFSVGGLKILQNIDLQVKYGECYGLIGPNGAGKTTTLNIINKFFLPTNGQIFWKGQDITKFRADQVAKLGIARTFQNIRLIKDLTVIENVMLGTYNHIKYNFMDSFLNRKTYREQEKHHRDQAFALLRALGLEQYADEIGTSLPYGIQRRVEVARALITKPTLLLLDEPTSGMNDAESDSFGDFIVKLRALNITIILIEHHIPVVLKTCDQVMALNFGVEIAQGKPNDVKQNPEVVKAYLGNDYATVS